MPTKKAIPEIPFDVIEKQFELGAIGDSIAVGRRSIGGYYIRIITAMSISGSGHATTKYDYFHLGADGSVHSAPRGYARDFKPGRITDMEAAVAKYAGVTE
jgi:hypothetical protein